MANVMDVIYAIIKDPENSKLRKISQNVITSMNISDAVLCQFHDYATDLYNAYSSCLESTSTDNFGFITTRQIREVAVNFNNTIKYLKEKYNEDLIAHSHRYGGWTSFTWNFNQDIQFVVATNFGYGSNSYFDLSIFYKGLKLAPYAKLVKYRYANFTSITTHTYEYYFVYSEWDKLMDDALNFYNAVVDKKDNQIFEWLSYHLETMTSELEKFINADHCCFDNFIQDNYFGSVVYRKSYEEIKGDDFWRIKSTKITEALLFLENIKSLPVQINPTKYVDKILRINETFLPKLIEKINSLETEISDTKEQIAVVCNDTLLSLYLKLREKYYDSKEWYLSSNNYSMILFLMRMLRRKSNITVSEIRSKLNLLDEKINELYELEDKLSDLQYFKNYLSDERDKIISFFNKTEDPDD